jgi:transposase
MSTSAALVLRKGDRQLLGDLAQPSDAPNDLARRARIVLLAADGMPNAQIARTVGVSRPTVIGWRDRYAQGGIKGLEDEPRTGRPRVIDEVDVVAATLANGGRPPARLGLTHWSARSLAAELGISFSSVARIWRKWDIQPQRLEAFSFRTEPELECRLGAVAGMFLDPPATMVVFSAGRITTSARRANGRQSRQVRTDEPGSVEALVTALRRAADRTGPESSAGARQRCGMLAFLEETVASHPGVLLRVVANSLEALPRPAGRSWLREDPGISFHAATADCTWLDLIAILFGVTAGADAAKDLVSAVRRLTDAHDGRRGPFTWINHPTALLADLLSAA